MTSWVLIVGLINGAIVSPTIAIPNFKSKADCDRAAAYALMTEQQGTKVQTALCLMGPTK